MPWVKSMTKSPSRGLPGRPTSGSFAFDHTDSSR
jgi:hypothetical protein